MTSSVSPDVAAVLAAIRTYNGMPVTAENLRWAATHEALCRSWTFDVLMGLADRLAALTPDTTPAGGETSAWRRRAALTPDTEAES